MLYGMFINDKQLLFDVLVLYGFVVVVYLLGYATCSFNDWLERP